MILITDLHGHGLQCDIDNCPASVKLEGGIRVEILFLSCLPVSINNISVIHAINLLINDLYWQVHVFVTDSEFESHFALREPQSLRQITWSVNRYTRLDRGCFVFRESDDFSVLCY